MSRRPRSSGLSTTAQPPAARYLDPKRPPPSSDLSVSKSWTPFPLWFSDGGREERTAVGQRVGRRPQAPHRRYAPQPSPHPVLSLPVSSPFPCRSLPLFLLQGTLWLSAIVGSIAYNWSRPGMKTSVKLIHARFVAPPFFCCFWSNIDVVSTWICRACWFI
jgi:hypothetical protein